MSGRLGDLHLSTAMTCPNNQAANPFFVDSLINVRGDAGSYYHSNGVYLPPEYSYGLPAGSSCFPGIAKRTEGSAPSGIPPSAPYAPGMETWLEASRSCRVEQPGGQHLSQQCSFSAAIKEESAYCLYESDKCPKGATVEDISFSGASCPPTGSSTVPVPGYFRLSQTYAPSKLYHQAQPSVNNFPPQRPPRAPAQPAPPAVAASSGKRESHEEAPASEPCAPARDQDSRLSSDGSPSSPEPADACGVECEEKPLKDAGKIESPANWLTAKSGRKKRCPYTKHQTLELEKEFLFNMYLTRERRLEISRSVHLTDRQVKIWFQNRRMKLKKMSRENRIRELSGNFAFT
ncbi:homeobox protein Hox-A10b [Syngnathus acus]|uniref:homeobox protein Hox-A10b n=1 Tax=Syngnathus acus TaxID=161584 RepID=UPI001885BB6C|nr:homeobox protein Hox-A10b [Syngnathus acus]